MSITLPIDALLPEIVEHLRNESCLVLEAPAGAGKTTRVPPALLELAGSGEIVVLEPRRLAARMAARRVAEEMNQQVGETVGYQVRFDEKIGTDTRIRFVTEGVLTRRLLSDPTLKSIRIVLLDEFHERHLQADLALALLRRLQLTSRPDLRIVVMSATLNAAPIAHFLGNCAVLRAGGKRFEVAIEHLARPDSRPLPAQVAAALGKLLSYEKTGDILVFLPGAAEIRRAREACEELAADLLILPLHGDLPLAEQDRAVRPASQRKVILATNVAESSITIEGITAVIESGLARIVSYSPWSGLPVINTARISQASAIQRAGRAGRTRPGRCLRLYTEQDFDTRQPHDLAEIQRADLSETVLELSAAGIADLSRFPWFEAPPEAALATARELLKRMGALDDQGITGVGRSMLRFPVHPRQARLIVEAEQRGVAADGCLLAALIGEKDIRLAMRGAGLVERSAQKSATGPSDLLLLLDAFYQAHKNQFSHHRLRAIGLDLPATLAVERVRQQLLDQLRRSSQSRIAVPATPTSGVEIEQALLISILAGYPDRVARARKTTSARIELIFAGGGCAQLAESSVVRNAEFIVAIDAEQRQGQSITPQGSVITGGRSTVSFVRLASRIEPEWLLDLFFDQIVETSDLFWQEESERVEVVERMMFDQLIIDESRAPAIGSAKSAELLTQAAIAVGPHAFIRGEELARWLARLAFVAQQFPEAEFPNLTETDITAALRRLCNGQSSFAQLRAIPGGLLAQLQQLLSSEQQKLLQKMAPDRVLLPGGRQTRIEYEFGKTPWLASRLQDFFGMANGPSIAGGRVAIVIHLLAPNQRAVQVTTDLAGFWARTYQQIRKELSRRYPRHPWPEDPLTASPPPVKKR